MLNDVGAGIELCDRRVQMRKEAGNVERNEELRVHPLERAGAPIERQKSP